MSEDVEMKDVSAENKNEVPKEKTEIPEVYKDFIKTIQLIDKSVILKDMKSLAMSYRLVNKFRKEFKTDDFIYLYNIYIKSKVEFPTFSSKPFDPNAKRNFEIQPNLLNKTKDVPEVFGYISLILLTTMVDEHYYEEVMNGVQFLISFLKQNENLTTQPLKAKAYYYLSLVAERLNKSETIIKELHDAYRTSCIQLDEIGQVTLINCIIRYYLNNNAIEIARGFLSKIKFHENVSVNEDARYLFYIGKIEAIQMNYSDAFSHLTNSYRKSPEKCGEGFKNTVNKLIIIVQLLMGEIPEVASILNKNQMRDFISFKPYLALVKAVKQGNLDEYKQALTLFKDIFESDGNYTLAQRIRHVVIKAGLRKINLSYSRISIKDITEKLKLESEKETEYIVAKAIRDGVFLAKIDHEHGYVQSMDINDVYSTFEPQKSFMARIQFLNKIFTDAQSAMKYGDQEKKKENDGELEEKEEMDRGFYDDF
ncbi:MAG: 26S proteasome non-ATPase regulatory subunit [archaeon]|nr:26S proteasome non-ATPase regulatory subunit [archaeon]